MIRGAEVEMCGSGPSGKTQVFPPGFSFLRHQFISVVVFTSAHAGKKQNGEGADHFRANFGPIFRNVTRCSCNHDFQRRKRMWTMQPHGFLPHAEGAQSQEVPAKSWRVTGQVFKISVPTLGWNSRMESPLGSDFSEENESHLLLGGPVCKLGNTNSSCRKCTDVLSSIHRLMLL